MKIATNNFFQIAKTSENLRATNSSIFDKPAPTERFDPKEPRNAEMREMLERIRNVENPVAAEAKAVAAAAINNADIAKTEDGSQAKPEKDPWAQGGTGPLFWWDNASETTRNTILTGASAAGIIGGFMTATAALAGVMHPQNTASFAMTVALGVGTLTTFAICGASSESADEGAVGAAAALGGLAIAPFAAGAAALAAHTAAHGNLLPAVASTAAIAGVLGAAIGHASSSPDHTVTHDIYA